MLKRFYALSVCVTLFLSMYTPSHAYEGQFFLVSAYYSPLPGQSYYLHGDYETEIWVNGKGTHGASGQAVRPGMIAAPKNYPFYAKINLEWVGVGTVLDRGGAIVEADASGSFTRLDVHVWEGEEWLCRAIKFGIQSIYGTVFTLEESKEIGEDTIDYDSFEMGCDFLSGSSSTKKTTQPKEEPKPRDYKEEVLNDAVTINSSSKHVRMLKTLLGETWYLIGGINDEFDSNLINSIFRFQLSNDVITGPYDTGAGFYGPKTREALRNVLAKADEPVQETTDEQQNEIAKNEDQESEPEKETVTPVVKQAEVSIFDTRILPESSEDDIRELQYTLTKIDFYDSEPDGQYSDSLVQAIFDFQVAYDIVQSDSDIGAGYFGPKTRAKMRDVYENYSVTEKKIQKLKSQIQELKTQRVEFIMQKQEEFKREIELYGFLKQWSVSENVRNLQKYLKQFGFMDHVDTGYFGPATAKALAQYQVDLGVIDSVDAQFAWFFWPGTRAAMKDDLLKRFDATDRTHLNEIDDLETEIKSLQS